jgi:hypothetical protein
MENLLLEESFKTPLVSFHADTGILSLKGRVFPENPDEFFLPILDWVKNYSVNPAEETHLTLFLSYFNSTSSEYIFRLCKSVEAIATAGKTASIVWEFESEDEDMKQVGEDYAEILKLNFALKAVL